MNETDELVLGPFDASDYLDSEETIAEYLRAALENPDPDAFLTAVRDVAKARGIFRVVAEAGLVTGEPLQGAEARRPPTFRHHAPAARRPGGQARYRCSSFAFLTRVLAAVSRPPAG